MFAPQLPAQQLLAHATQLHRGGSYAAAIDVYRQLLRSFPNNPEILDKLGAALAATGQTEEARKHIEKAIKLAPGNALFFHDLHLTYKREGKLKEAIDAIDKALKLSPRQPIFTAALAELHIQKGDWDRALRVLEPVRSHAGEAPPVGFVLANLAPRFGLEKEAADALRRLLSRNDVAGSNRVRAHFALAYLLDISGDFDGAWESILAANALRGKTWDVEAHRRSVDATISAWTPDAVANAPKARIDGSSILLVVGMPRSGGSLVALTLAAVPGSTMVGEMNDLMLAARDLQGIVGAGAPIFNKVSTLTESALTERGSAYVNKLRAARPGDKVISDRLPLNLLNLGLISRMLPGVRVINCTRDRSDVAIAASMQMFQASYPFLHDLAGFGAFIRDADRLMAHWKQVLPDVPVLDVAYEDLLGRPEATARRMVEFIGMPWTAEALEPSRKWVATVTLPDGTMRDIVPDARVGIAKDYQKHLAPFNA